ncbi:MAG: hypothetical protein R3335_08010 [Anaerolineales bacterium]|nr:hypothetical protein [Anaerolineales bacterium]
MVNGLIWMRLARLFIFPAVLILLAACSSFGGGTAEFVPGSDSLVFDAVCEDAINQTFLSEHSILLGEVEDGSSYWGPVMVSFLSDGRALWRYKVDPVFGTFSCEDGSIKAVFTEGELEGFEADFDPQRMAIVIDGVIYQADTDI